MKSEYIQSEALRVLINSMHYENGVALLVSLETGMRIGDVLKMRRKDIKGNVVHYVAEKTGKAGTAELSPELLKKIKSVWGKTYVFEGQRHNAHRTRQAVYLDIKRVCKEYGVDGQISPHSARKSFSVDDFRENGLDAVKEHLQHSSTAVTMLYALADKLPTGDSDIESTGNIAQEMPLIFAHLAEIERKLDWIIDKILQM